METATLSALLRCHPAVGPVPDRVGLVVDYRGDHPPIRLFALLREFGWRTPAPHSPPAAAIDWNRPDPVSDRSWSLRPFVVTGALAVPGAETPPEATTLSWLQHVLDRVGVPLDDEAIDVGTLREIRPGLADVLEPGMSHHLEGDVPAAPPEQSVEAMVLAAVAVTEVAPAPVPVQPVAPESPANISGGPVTGSLAPTAERAAVVVEGRGERSASPLLWSPPDPALHTRTVWAVIRRGALDRVHEVLEARDLQHDVLLTAVAGFGRGGGRVTKYRGRDRVEMLQRIQLQVPVDPDDVEDLVAALVQATRAGEKGDGKIWVT